MNAVVAKSVKKTSENKTYKAHRPHLAPTTLPRLSAIKSALLAFSGLKVSLARQPSLRDAPSVEIRPLDFFFCSEESKQWLQSSQKLMSQNFQEILDESRLWLDDDSIKKLTQCFEKEDQSCVSFFCYESDHFECDGALGYYQPSYFFDDAIFLCMRNIKKEDEESDNPSIVSKLAGVVAHETAHRCGVPVDLEKHNKKIVLDAIYRFGFAAEGAVRTALGLVPSKNNDQMSDHKRVNFFLKASGEQDALVLFQFYNFRAKYDKRFDELNELIWSAEFSGIRQAAAQALIYSGMDENGVIKPEAYPHIISLIGHPDYHCEFQPFIKDPLFIDNRLEFLNLLSKQFDEGHGQFLMPLN